MRADHVEKRGLFPQGFTHGSPAVGNLMSDAGHVITLCARFLASGATWNLTSLGAGLIGDLPSGWRK